MKKLTDIIGILLVFILCASMLLSCGGKDKEGSAEALDLFGKNLTISLSESYDGDKLSATVIVIDGETYYNSDFGGDQYWYVDVGDQYLNVIASAGSKFSSFENNEGKYHADTFIYTEDGYDYELVNVWFTFDSEGRLATFHFEEAEEDCNRVYDITLSGYGEAQTPDEELIVRDDDSITTDPEAPDGPGHIENPDDSKNESDDPAGNTPDDPADTKPGEGNMGITEKEWMDAFDLRDSNLTAMIYASSPGGVVSSEVRLVNGVTYCLENGSDEWLVGTLNDLLQNISPFMTRYSEFELKGDAYFCAKSGLDLGEGNSLVDITIRFDAKGRITHVSYSMIMGSERGDCSIDFGKFGETVAPEIEGGVDVDGDGTIDVGDGKGEGNMSGDNYPSHEGDGGKASTPDAPVGDGSVAPTPDADNNGATDSKGDASSEDNANAEDMSDPEK